MLHVWYECAVCPCSCRVGGGEFSANQTAAALVPWLQYWEQYEREKSQGFGGAM
jgi:hypothetical protein